MRLMTSNELQRLSRRELIDLLDSITARLAELPASSQDRANALHNLGLIQSILAKRGFALKHLTP